MELSEPLGLLLQLLPQHSIALRGDISEWHSARAETGFDDTSFTKPFDQTYWTDVESAGIRGWPQRQKTEGSLSSLARSWFGGLSPSSRSGPSLLCASWGVGEGCL